AIALLLGTVTVTAAVRLKPDTAYSAAAGTRSVRLQPDRDPVERGTLRLHYVQKPIGYERYEIVREGDDLKLTSDFDFTDRGGNVVRLDRYAIDGVVWGRETVWLDDKGSLAAAITRAGGLSFEAVREDLEPALSGFVQRATRDRIGDLENITQQIPLLKRGTY